MDQPLKKNIEEFSPNIMDIGKYIQLMILKTNHKMDMNPHLV